MDVIQIPLPEQQKPIPNIRTRTSFILDERVDEEVLRNALDRLIRDYWRKLGARLATRPKDGLSEYHLPRTFGEGYLLFNWSSQEYDHSIDKVHLLPKVTPSEEGIALLPHLRSVEGWFKPSDWPLDRKSEPPGAPLLYVHLSLFTDASVIAISCPHIVVDQFGLSNVMRAWLGLVKGEEPPSMIGVYDDVLASEKPYSDYSAEEVVRKGKMRVRRRMEYPLVLLGFLPELILRPKEDSYTLFFPQSLAHALRERHTKTLTDKYGSDPGITNSDIVSGALLKLSRLHKKSRRIISFSQCVNLRGRIPQLERDRDAFIHCALQYSSARFPIDPSTPLSEIAYRNRKAITEAVDQKDIEIGLAVMREMVRRGQGTHICEPFERSFFLTNWSAAWKGLDFGPAVKAGENEASAVKLLVLGESKILDGPDRFSPTILCKTAEGYWCNFSVPQKTTRLIEEYLKKDPMLENF